MATAESPPGTVTIGSQVKLSLKDGDDVVGTVFSYEPAAKIWVLVGNTSSTKCKFSIIPANSVTQCTLLAPPEPGFSIDEILPNVNVNDSIRIEEQACKSAMEQYEQMGVGVTDDAQNLFDFFANIYAHMVFWNGTDITIPFLGVEIKAPYGLENVEKMATGSDDAVGRIKIMLEKAKRKAVTSPVA